MPDSVTVTVWLNTSLLILFLLSAVFRAQKHAADNAHADIASAHIIKITYLYQPFSQHGMKSFVRLLPMGAQGLSPISVTMHCTVSEQLNIRMQSIRLKRCLPHRAVNQ